MQLSGDLNNIPSYFSNDESSRMSNCVILSTSHYYINLQVSFCYPFQWELKLNVEVVLLLMVLNLKVGGSPLSSTELNSGRHLLVLATAVERRNFWWNSSKFRESSFGDTNGRAERCVALLPSGCKVGFYRQIRHLRHPLHHSHSRSHLMAATLHPHTSASTSSPPFHRLVAIENDEVGCNSEYHQCVFYIPDFKKYQ